jgi:methionyl-tRNA formyltransferase
MNIIILANRDIASNYAVNLLLPKLSEHKITIFLSAKVGGISKKPTELIKLKFFEQDLYNRIIAPLLPSPAERSSSFMTFEQMSASCQQPVIELNNINSIEGLAMLDKAQPDLILSIRYGVILKNAAISSARIGVLNLHSGLLPNYRGVMATFWAMLNGEKTIGTTLHYIDDANIDTGDIVDTTTMKVDSSRSYLSHVLELYQQGSNLMANTVNKIASGKTIACQPQIDAGNYYSFPNDEKLSAFTAKGLTLVDEQELIQFITDHYY